MSEPLRLRCPRTAETAGAEPQAQGSEPPAGKTKIGGLEPTLNRFIIKYSWRQQVMPLLLTAISFPFLYYSYDLPKTIVNRAIGGKNFPQEFLGFSFGQIHYLMVLCGVFLALVFINGAFK